MKSLLLLIFISSMPTFASEGQLLKCLGAEEKRFHLKKETGPLYDLNQKLIAEMVQIPFVDVGPEDLKEICTPGKLGESWKLLETSIKRKKDLFIIDKKATGMQKQMTAGMVDDYVEATKEILLNFISAIQTLSPTPNCLKEQIPELDAFFTDIKYLQEDVDIKKIFDGRDQKIFEKLKDYPVAFKACSEREKAKKKAKPKKKTKP